MSYTWAWARISQIDLVSKAPVGPDYPVAVYYGDLGPGTSAGGMEHGAMSVASGLAATMAKTASTGWSAFTHHLYIEYI